MTQASPNTRMPGAFNFTSQRDHGAAPRLSGAKSHVFQPPRTPSVSASSSLYLTRSVTSSAMSAEHTSVNAGRKRTRVDYDVQPPNDEFTASELREAPGSPMPFVNTRYALAGGMDTPTLAVAQAQEVDEGQYSDYVGYRREMSGDEKLKGLFGDEGGYQSFLPLDSDRESNTESRRSSTRFTGQGEGWSRTAFEVVGGVVGGVVGKVWEFCKTSAFRGFHAGGGNGYTITAKQSDPIHPSIEEDSFWEAEKSAHTWGLADKESTPLPGQFPAEDFIPDYMDRATPEATPPRASKRRQVSTNNGDELTKNWVVVPPTNTNVHTPTPAKPQPRGPARYSMPTTSSASRRSVVGRPASRAGGAVSLNSPRRPMLQSRVSHAGSPALSSTRGASFASPRGTPGSRIPRVSSPMIGVKTANMNGESPAAKEARQWAAQKRKEEREADESMRRFDAQLKALIREGKEALGTKIEIEIDDDLDSYSSPSKGKKWAF